MQNYQLIDLGFYTSYRCRYELNLERQMPEPYLDLGTHYDTCKTILSLQDDFLNEGSQMSDALFLHWTHQAQHYTFVLNVGKLLKC